MAHIIHEDIEEESDDENEWFLKEKKSHFFNITKWFMSKQGSVCYWSLKNKSIFGENLRSVILIVGMDMEPGAHHDCILQYVINKQINDLASQTAFNIFEINTSHDRKHCSVTIGNMVIEPLSTKHHVKQVKAMEQGLGMPLDELAKSVQEVGVKEEPKPEEIDPNARMVSSLMDDTAKMWMKGDNTQNKHMKNESDDDDDIQADIGIDMKHESLSIKEHDVKVKAVKQISMKDDDNDIHMIEDDYQQTVIMTQNKMITPTHTFQSGDSGVGAEVMSRRRGITSPAKPVCKNKPTHKIKYQPKLK
eukprot:19963_1